MYMGKESDWSSAGDCEAFVRLWEGLSLKPLSKPSTNQRERTKVGARAKERRGFVACLLS